MLCAADVTFLQRLKGAESGKSVQMYAARSRVEFLHPMDRERTVVLIVLAILVFALLVDGLSAQDSHPNVQSDDVAKGQFGKAYAAPVPRIFFREVASEAGITTVPITNTDRRYVLETAGGGGIALFDCDNDGKLDLAVVNDSTIEQYRM